MNSIKQPDDRAAIKDFVQRVETTIRERFGNRLISRSHLREIQAYIKRQWAQHYYWYPGPYLLAEGCSVSGLEAVLKRGMLGFRWNTVFIPGPRHTTAYASAQPLGFFGELDLYAQYEIKNGHASVIVVPNTHSRYEWRLYEQRLGGPQMHAEAVREALRRAQMVNAFCGSKFARPAPMGKAGMPVRRMPGDCDTLL